MGHIQKDGTTNQLPGLTSKMQGLLQNGQGKDFPTNGSGNMLHKAQMAASILGETIGMIPQYPFRTKDII